VQTAETEKISWRPMTGQRRRRRRRDWRTDCGGGGGDEGGKGLKKYDK